MGRQIPVLPDRYKFAEVVPEGPDGGARCSTCHYWRGRDKGDCVNKFYRQSNNGDGSIPAAPEGFCCAAWSAQPRS